MLVLLLVPLLARTGLAEPPVGEAAKQEARERFDQGLKLFNEGNNAAALAEFERAYAVVPNATVLLNIALVHAAMDRPVEAVDALERVLEHPSELSSDDVARAAQLRSEQLRRVASVTIDLEQAGAAIEVDGVQVGKTPLGGPLRVAAGRHVFAVVLTGYHPVHQEVTIAGGETRRLELDLVALERRSAALAIHSALTGATVWVDAKKLAVTPLQAELSVAPGVHQVELQRPCYRTARATIELAAGTSGELTLEPEIDTASLGQCGGRLALSIANGAAAVEIDGRSQPVGQTAFELPQGDHRVRVTRAGHLPFDASVSIPAQRTTHLAVKLEPTADVLAVARHRTRRQRVVGLSALGLGAVAVGAGAAFLVKNGEQIQEAEDDIDAFNLEARDGGGGRCDALSGLSAGELAACEAERDELNGTLDDRQRQSALGYVGVGVGGALVVTGAALVLFNKSPARRAAHTALLAPAVAPDLRGGWVGVRASF